MPNKVTQPQTPRRRFLKLGLCIAAATAAAASITACGGGSDGPPPPPPVPTLEILCNDVGVLASETKITFLFSADVSQFAVNRFVLTGGTVDASTFTRVSGREYSVIVRPRANQTGTLTITVPPGAYYDATGVSPSRDPYYFSREFNTVVPPTVPTVDFADDAPGYFISGPVTLTITFSLDIGDSFEPSDLAVTNATPNAFTKVSATEYTVRLTPPTGARVLITVTLPAGSVTAVGGSANNRDWSWGKIYLPAT
jgi:hypothetical protein